MQAPEAMMMSRIFSFSVSAPQDPTLMIDLHVVLVEELVRIDGQGRLTHAEPWTEFRSPRQVPVYPSIPRTSL